MDDHKLALLFPRAGLALLFLIGCLGTGLCTAYAGEIILTNGDRISGRIISMSSTTARISTPHSGILEIDRTHIQRLVTDDLTGAGTEESRIAVDLQELRGKGADGAADSREIDNSKAEAAARPESIGQKPENEEDIRRIFLRQSSVLLNPGEKEVEAGFSYLSNQLSVAIYNARFRQFQVPISLRIGLWNRAEGFVTLPLTYAKQEFSFADDSTSQTTSGIGDATAGFNYELFRETAFWPDMVASLSVKAPTGDEPGEEGLSTGSGHWSGSLGMQFIKTSDPVVLFWGLRYTHAFSARHFLNDGVYDVQPGDIADYNFGFGFAVNDRISLGTQVSGSYQWKTKTDGRAFPGSSGETVSLRSALTYRVSKKTYIEPSLAIGLNDETADFVMGFAVTRRFGK